MKLKTTLATLLAVSALSCRSIQPAQGKGYAEGTHNPYAYHADQVPALRFVPLGR